MSYPAPAPQPGWYPDPSGGPGQRYFDGHQWTVAAPPAPPSQVLVVGGPNNALHLALTFLTCGMWLPVWLIVTLVDNQRARAAGQPRRANPTLIVVLAVVGGLYLTGLARYELAGFPGPGDPGGRRLRRIPDTRAQSWAAHPGCCDLEPRRPAESGLHDRRSRRLLRRIPADDANRSAAMTFT